MSIPATPVKLPSGAWGARIKGTAVHPGDEITITTRAGKSWTAIVGAIVSTTNGVSLVGTAASNSSAAHSSCAGRCKGCGHVIKDAPHHRAMGGYCGDCAFDEFDM